MRPHRQIAIALLMLAHVGCSPARTAPGATEGYVDVGQGVRLFYRMVGAGRDTLVVLHGGPGFSMDYLAADLEPLATDLTVVFYDQRGTGRSSLVSDSVALDAQRFAEDLEAVRRHFGIGRLTLLGHSWGAGVAALYAIRYPERVGRMLIVDGMPLRQEALIQTFEALEASRDTAQLRQMGEWRAARATNPGDAAACRSYYVLWFQPFFVDSTALGRSKGDFCAGTPEALANKVRAVDRVTFPSLGRFDWRPPLRGVTAPALVIHGTADVIPVRYAREWAQALPESRLLLIERAGHFPYLEAPEVFFPAVTEFVRGGWPSGATVPPRG